MYDRRVSAILGEDDSVEEELVWNEMSSGKQNLYPRLLFVVTGDISVLFCFVLFFKCYFSFSIPCIIVHLCGQQLKVYE